MLSVGQGVRFNSPGGSIGRIEAPNPYGGYYVRWHYGYDLTGEPMTALSSVRAADLAVISEETIAEWETFRGNNKERVALAQAIDRGDLLKKSGPPPPLSFNQLRTVNVRRCKNDFRHDLNGWSVLEWGGAASGELGEALNVAKKMIRHRDGVAGNKGDDTDLRLLKAKLRREMADAAIYLDLWAASEDIDLGEAIRETFNAKSDEIGSREKL